VFITLVNRHHVDVLVVLYLQFLSIKVFKWDTNNIVFFSKHTSNIHDYFLLIFWQGLEKFYVISLHTYFLDFSLRDF
jgi:hypothetical protein